MATKQNKNIKVRDLKPRKDAKGGAASNNASLNVGLNVGMNTARADVSKLDAPVRR